MTSNCIKSTTTESPNIASEYSFKAKVHLKMLWQINIKVYLKLQVQIECCSWLVCLHWNYIILYEVCVIEH